MFVHHVVNHTWGLRYPYRRGETEKVGVEIEVWGTSAYLHGSFKKISSRDCLFFNCFVVVVVDVDKKKVASKLFLLSLDYWVLLICLAMAQDQGKDIHYSWFSWYSCLEEGGVFAWEGREWLTWGKEGFSWRTGGRENLYSRLTIKWTSSKTVFKDIHYTLTAPSINCFWKSIYCITQKINISEHACQTFLKELAIFLKYRKLW